MKRLFFSALLASVLLLAGGTVLAQQQGGGQGQPPQGQGWFCPWCGQYSGQGQGMYQGGRGMGPGMMRGHQGRGMGPGMMQDYRGRGMGPGMMRGQQGRGMMRERWGRGQYGPNRQQQQQQMGPLDQNTARRLAENYVAGNPNLKVGKVTEKENSFVATVVTRDGSMVEKLLIDKETGWMKKQY